MTVAIKTLSLITPGLLDEMPPEALRDQFRQHAALRRILDRAETLRVDVSGFENTLLQVIAGESCSLSHAWLTRQGEQSDQKEQVALPTQGTWLRADPVLMQADRSNVVLFGAQALAIHRDEADSLVAELNATYADLGWVFEAADPQRWYLHIPTPPRIRCTPLTDMIGRSVRDLLPAGEDSLFWHRTLNEIQMLFYQSPVNLARREAGAPEINSVWIWGNGEQEMPAPRSIPEPARVSHLWGDDVLLRGLAIARDVKIKPLPEQATGLLGEKSSGKQLLQLTGLQQGSAIAGEIDRAKVLQQYEQDWFAPLLAMLRSRQIDVIEIWPCNGQAYRVTRSELLRFWRKSGWQKRATRT